jgi:hypothetical protein
MGPIYYSLQPAFYWPQFGLPAIGQFWCTFYDHYDLGPYDTLEECIIDIRILDKQINFPEGQGKSKVKIGVVVKTAQYYELFKFICSTIQQNKDCIGADYWPNSSNGYGDNLSDMLECDKFNKCAWVVNIGYYDLANNNFETIFKDNEDYAIKLEKERKERAEKLS